MGLLLTAAPQAEAASPEWKLTVTPSANFFVPGPADQTAFYTIEAENVGEAPTSASPPIKLEDTLPAVPAGLSVEAVHFYDSELKEGGEGFADLAAALCPSSLECEYPGPLAGGAPPLQRGQRLIMQLRLAVPAGLSGPLTDVAKVRGGGAAKAAAASASNEIAAAPPVGIRDFSAPLDDFSKTNPYTQAGGHPYQLLTEVNLATQTVQNTHQGANWGESGISPVHDPRDIAAELPPGLIGNPQAVPHCSLADFFDHECPISTVVGTVGIRAFGIAQGGLRILTALFNLQPTGAYPGELGYTIGFPFLLTAGLRSGSDYGLNITSVGIPEVGLQRARITTWGVPAEESHDLLRGKTCSGLAWTSEFVQSMEQIERECEAEPGDGEFEGGPAESPEVPFLTLPTQCTGEPLAFGLRATFWQLPGTEATAPPTADPPVGACNALEHHFNPTIEARPTTDLADAPSGLRFDLHLPQNHEGPDGKEDPHGVATPDLKEAVVTLPQGLAVNPSSGNGLAGCSPAQIGLRTPVGQTPAHFTEIPARCPDASKIGVAEVNTPLLHEPLGSIPPLPGRVGNVYLATPNQNPFGSLLAAYIVLEGEGLIIKLPGKIEANPQTGQLTGRFTENPQTPFEDFHLEFFGGARGDLRTPAVCGSYQTTSTLTPWSAPESGPPAESGSAFQLDNGGTACPHQASELPNAPVLRAGTESAEAGRFSPFSLRLARADGSQEIAKIETTLPPGLVGKLAGVGECSEAQLAVAKGREHEGGGAEEQASPSCPSSSEVGTVQVASGAGPTPLYVTGHAYLTGPYRGAPLSLAIITPAVAGPFDLGDVLVRTALYVDPTTAQIKAVSDEIPHILQGIPLDVRSITLKMSRPNFMINPTNCEELPFSGAATSVLGAVAPLTQRFQVGGCPALGFEPHLSIRLKGSTRHAGHPALSATLTMPSPGTRTVPCRRPSKKGKKKKKARCHVKVPPQANIARAQVNLPHSEFIDQGNLNKTCTRPVLLEGACPKTSIYGKAKAWTPLLERPLEGPVYLVGGFGYKLPALVAELNGQIRVLLVGKVDSGPNHGIRNTFEVVPDAPVEKFELRMKGGPKYSLLENSEDLCARRQKAIASFTAQNGRTVEFEPTVANSCGGKHRKHGRHAGHGRHHGAHGKANGRRARAGAPAGALAALLSRGW